ncbi:hypothetical protein KOXM_10284 [Klebsiella michiganensis]|nr:hypothetical protein KOXM_10284 [Klebsiella michiganensis]
MAQCARRLRKVFSKATVVAAEISLWMILIITVAVGGARDSFHYILKVQGRDVRGVIDQVIMN